MSSEETHHMFPAMAPDHHLSGHQYSGGPEQQPEHISVRQYPSTSSAFSSSAHTDQDWTKVSDLAERRRIQNRIAQRNYRKKIKERMADLERRAGSDGSTKASTGTKKARWRTWTSRETQPESYGNPLPAAAHEADFKDRSSFSHPGSSTSPEPLSSKEKLISPLQIPLNDVKKLEPAEWHEDFETILSGRMRQGKQSKISIKGTVFLDCIYEATREFIDLILADRRSSSFARGLLHAVSDGRDITSDLNIQIRLMASEIKAECSDIAQLDASVFLDTYSRYISVVAIDRVKDIFTGHAQDTSGFFPTHERRSNKTVSNINTTGPTEGNPRAALMHEDMLEQLVAETLPSVLYVDMLPHRQFLASSSAFASFIDALNSLVYPTFFSEAAQFVKATICSANASEDRLLALEGQHVLAILSEMKSCLSQGKTPISFSMKASEGFVSVLDRAKIAIETSTAAQWDWWPLQPPSRAERHDRAQLSWQCSCGDRRRESILSYYGPELQRIFNKFPISTGMNSAPVDRPPSSISSGGSRGTGSSHSAKSSSSNSLGEQSGSSSSSTANSTITTPDSVVDFGTGPPRYIYIFLLTRSSEYGLDTIDVSSMKARDFFQELKAAYNKQRGLWRRAFSVFVYNHCDFIKIIKPEPDTFMPGELKFELPSDHDDEYHYRPRPIYSPPITKHMFRHYFYGCYDSGALSHRLHACLPLASTCRIRNPAEELLEFFPKRDRPVAATAQSDKVEVIYGLAAREFRSFFRVVVYLCLAVAPAFGFVFAWLFVWGDSGDLQDATVPMTLMLAILSILWAVIYSGSDVRKDYGDGT